MRVESAEEATWALRIHSLGGEGADCPTMRYNQDLFVPRECADTTFSLLYYSRQMLAQLESALIQILVRLYAVSRFSCKTGRYPLLNDLLMDSHVITISYFTNHLHVSRLLFAISQLKLLQIPDVVVL